MVEKEVKKTRLEVENVKVNVSEMSRRTGLSNKTIKKKINGYQAKKTRKKRGSKLDPYTEIIKDKYDNYDCTVMSIYHFIKKIMDMMVLMILSKNFSVSIKKIRT